MSEKPLLRCALLLVAAGSFAGCADEASSSPSTAFDVRPAPGAEKHVAFTAEELDASPAMRRLGLALERAREGHYLTDAEGVETREVLLAIDEKWAQEHGTRRNDDGQPLSTPRIVLIEGETYRVLVVTSH